MAGEQIVKLSASGATDVLVWTTKLDHNLDKPVISINMPNFGDDMDNKVEPTTTNIDLGRVKQLITVQGFLYDDSSESALTRKTNLFKLVKFYRTVTITWGTDTGGGSQNEQTATGIITKCMTTETPGKIGTQGPTAGDSGEKNFAVQLALVVGTDSMI